MTPLYDTLRAFAGKRPLRMHMPGHKGKHLPLPELGDYAALDVTELPPTGNLYEGGGPIGAAQALWAQAFQMEHCLFLTGGSTQGILAALTLACRPGGRVLIDRGCHRSVYNALALLDLDPVYCYRKALAGTDILGPISPDRVEQLLEEHPDVKTFCLTSPSYYGVLSDIPALAARCHARGVKLVVDAAHGAHLPFLGHFDLARADLVVVSAHKTLSAPGQSALLLAGPAFSGAEIRRAASLYGSSSPSYPMMAALDVCREWMEGPGARQLAETARQVSGLRRRFPALTGDQALKLDPCRLTIRTGDGFALERALEERGIYAEMADRGNVIFICSAADSQADFQRLAAALAEQLPLLPPPGQPVGPPPAAEQVCSLRGARLGEMEVIPVNRAEGRIAADQIAPYPPGVPVVAPGERITKKMIAYLYEIGYNMGEGAAVLPTDAPCRPSV